MTEKLVHFYGQLNRSLKAVSLHNSDQFTSILAVHSVNVTAIYETVKKLLKTLAMNITTGLYVETSRCWDFFYIYKVDTQSILVSSV
jgi:hypothetical protein